MNPVDSIKNYLARAREYLNTLGPRRLVVLLLIIYALVFLGQTARYGFNPSAMIHLGHYYIQQNEDLTPDGAVRFIGSEKYGGNGYDGQIFYYFARTVFMKDVWPAGFNNAYRAPRVGYPLLAGLFSPLGSWGVVLGMIIVQLVLIVWGLVCLWRILPANLKYLSVFYVISPFTLQSFAVLVSDSLVVALWMIGLYYYLRMYEGSPLTPLGTAGFGGDKTRGFGDLCFRKSALAGFCFSLAVLTKESSLFLFFPLGLYALWRLDLPRILLMLGVLLPMVAWQLYLRSAHGMVPAGVLEIFLKPLNGVSGLFVYTLELIRAFLSSPSIGGLLVLFKHSAKVLLFLLIPAAILAMIKGRRPGFPLTALTLGFALLSVLIADYYYFWGIYENISRMFTPLVVLMLLHKRENPDSLTWPFFGALTALAFMVFLRLTLLVTAHPADIHKPYSGPDYGPTAPLPDNFLSPLK